MSTITQRIPNLFLGISQQPDNKKFPGQVSDAVNVFPDYALGLLKRPGGKLLGELYGATASGRWFSILRDDQEKYVGQYANNTFRIWSLLDGTPRMVDMGSNTGVPIACNYTNVQTNLLNYNAAKAVTQTRLEQLQDAEQDYVEALAGQNATTETKFQVNFTYPSGDITEYVVSGVLLNQSGVYTVKVNNSIISAANTLPSGYALGTERTNEHPLIAQNGLKVYEVDVTVAATHTPAQLSAAQAALTTAEGNYTAAVADEASKKGLYDSEIANCAITSVPSNAYLKDATPDDIELLTLNDYTFVLNKKKVVQMKGATVAALPHQAFVVIDVVAYAAQYIVKLDATEVTYQTPSSPNQSGTYSQSGTTVTAKVTSHGFYTGQTVAIDFSPATADNGSYIVTVTSEDQFSFTVPTTATATGGLTARAAMDANLIAKQLSSKINAVSGFTATQVGAGIYISKSSSFSIETRGSTDSNGLYAFQDQIANISRLPVQCKNGYKVKVVNSNEIDVDDMWVEFVTTNAAAYGPGTWEETNAPGITYQLDELTMPHQLVRQSNGSFKFEPVVWEDRLVGDNQSNPLPSFVGSTIRNIFFFRNRLGFLSNEAVILSKAGDYFNFFATTAMTVTNDDPIDLTATSTRPVTLNYVKSTSVGLVLYGSNEQFILTTDSDVLSPTTAKINTLSTYECEPDVEAIALGTTQAFLSKTPLYSRLFELYDISNDRPPYMVDDTRVVPELIPSTINNIIASPGLSIVSLATTGSSTVYQYRFLQQGEKRPLESWYKWELTGNLLDQFFDASTYYTVITCGTCVYIVSMDLTQSSDIGFLSLPTGEKTDVCLDLWRVNPYRTYNAGTDTTRVFLPFNLFAGKTVAAVILGEFGSVLYPTIQGTSGNYYFDVDGDYRGLDLVVGYIYDMSVELPKFFVTRASDEAAASDLTADLIIHRMKVATGLSGPITYQVNITGRPTWEDSVNVTLPNQYVLNNVNLAAEALHNVPLYQRNNNLLVRVIGDTPFPVSLLSITWEGRYNNGFYRRV